MHLPADAAARRAGAALAVTLATLGLLLVVLRLTPLTHLPEYSAVALSFAFAVLLPGLIVQRALLGADAEPLERLAVAPALGLTLTVVPGFIALEAHTSLDNFAVMYAAFTAICCGASMLFWQRNGDHEAAAPERGNLLVAGMLLIVLGGIVTTPLWARNRLAGDFDDWTYMAYVNSYLYTDKMNAHEPFLGTGAGVTPRMRDNVWVLTEALVSRTSGVPPEDVLLEYLRPVLTVLAVLATYALTLTLFRRGAIALIAVAFQLGWAFLDVADHEGLGRSILLRITEDKMVSAFILFPIGLVFLARFATRPNAGAFIGFTMVAAALSLVHPVPLIFLAITIVWFAALRVWSDRSLHTARALAPLLLPVAVGSIWPFVQRQLLAHTAPALFGTEESSITFRNNFRITELGHSIVIGNYHMLIHPLMLAAIVLAPIVWLTMRRGLGNQLAAAMTGGALVAFLFPLVSSPISKIMTPQTLWKVPWMIPVAPVLASAAYRGVDRLSRVAARGRVLLLVVAPGAAVVIALAAALLVQEQYARLDHGNFYDGTSDSSFLPGTSASIFRGGIDRAFSAVWRVSSQQRALFEHLDEDLPPGSVVLAEPPIINRMIPGLLTDIYPVDFGGTAGEGQRREDVNAFAAGQLTEPAQLDAVINRWKVNYIVVPGIDATNKPLPDYPRAQLLREVGPYEIYAVRR